MNRQILFTVLLLTTCGVACMKEDPGVANQYDSSLFNTPYCNDPEAINYNWDFPGTPDNSICFYPTDVFAGTYLFDDTIYNEAYERDTILQYQIVIRAYSNTRFALVGFCGDSIKLTADRFFKATIDSTLNTIDQTPLNGQIVCRTVDTISGTINTSFADSTRIRINFNVASDTGLNYHVGTAIQQ